MDPKLLKLHFTKASSPSDLLPLLQRLSGLEVHDPIIQSKETRDLLLSKVDLVCDDNMSALFSRCFTSIASTNEGREMCCREAVKDALVRVAKYVDSAECAKRLFGAINNITAGNHCTTISVDENNNYHDHESISVSSAAASSSVSPSPSPSRRRTSVTSLIDDHSDTHSVTSSGVSSSAKTIGIWRPSLTVKQLFSTVLLAQRIIAASKFCRTAESQEWFSRTIINLTQGNLLGKRIFSTETYRDETILYIIKFIKTPNNVALFCNAFYNICSQNPRGQDILSNDDTQLAFSGLAKIAVKSETAVKWVTKVLEIITSKNKKRKSGDLPKILWNETLTKKEFKAILTTGSLMNEHSVVMSASTTTTVVNDKQEEVPKAATMKTSESDDEVKKQQEEEKEEELILKSRTESVATNDSFEIRSTNIEEDGTNMMMRDFSPSSSSSPDRRLHHSEEENISNTNESDESVLISKSYRKENDDDDYNDDEYIPRALSLIRKSRSPDVEDPLENTVTFVDEEGERKKMVENAEGASSSSSTDTTETVAASHQQDRKIVKRDNHDDNNASGTVVSNWMTTTTPAFSEVGFWVSNKRRIILWSIILLVSFLTVRLGIRSRLFQYLKKKILG